MENHGNVSKGMIEVGYKPATAKNPKNLTKSKGWGELMESFLDDRLLAEKHRELLEATGIGHMVFPLDVTDDQIVYLLKEANCIAKRFMHSESQTHVWYFSPDNNSRKSALEMAYKLKGHYAPEKHEHLLGRKSTEKLQDEELGRLMEVFKKDE